MPGLCAAVSCNNRKFQGKKKNEREISEPSTSGGAGIHKAIPPQTNGDSVITDKDIYKRSWHNFPLKRPPIFRQWLNNMRRVGFYPSQHHKLCSDLVTEDSFIQGPPLSMMAWV